MQTFAVLAMLYFPPTTLAEPVTNSYTYDAVGRLTRVSYDDTTTITYTYDANGNLLGRVVSEDRDGDGVFIGGGTNPCTSGNATECEDNCPFEPNNGGDDIQRDSDGNGRGDACECGNADRSTRVDIFDALHIAQGTLTPPLVEMIHLRACDADGNGKGDIFDALRVAQATLSPPLAEIVQECEAATVAPASP